MKSRLLLRVHFRRGALVAGGYTIITDTNHLTTVTYTNGFFNGYCTIEGRSRLRWVPLQNFWTTQHLGQATFSLPTNTPGSASCGHPSRRPHARPSRGWPRPTARSAPWPALAWWPPGVNAWQTNYEGDYATNVFLSDPRNAVADRFGTSTSLNAKDTQSTRSRPTAEFTPCLARTRQAPGADSTFGTNSALYYPSALHLVGDRLYVLDAGTADCAWSM